MDNPPMNVLSEQVTNELGEGFKQLRKDDDVISIIVTGVGDKGFMAEADIKELRERNSE